MRQKFKGGANTLTHTPPVVNLQEVKLNNYLTNIVMHKRAALQATGYPRLFAGLVISQSRDICRVAVGGAELFAKVSGKLRQSASSPADFPVTGDFVMVDRADNSSGDAVIHHVLERKSLFVRKAAGTSREAQAVAANVDVVFLCMGLDNDFNIRRLERYLSIAWDSGAAPIVVLTKSDLCGDTSEKLLLAQQAALGAEVIVTSAFSQGGAQALMPYIKGKTAAFLGSSGVGKSTLINALAGGEVMKTGNIRSDGKGRHTTTTRELIALCGGAVIDTPGMREIGLESADLASSFSDIEELAESCRFSDCSHTCEPGCAVLEAVKQGTISGDRLAAYLKLKKEAGYEGLNSRQIEAKKTKEMFAGFGGIKNAKAYIKAKYKRD